MRLSDVFGRFSILFVFFRNNQYVAFMKRILIIFLFIFILHGTAKAASFDPHINWKSLKTDHFDVNYPQNLESVAQDMGRILEEAHANLTKDLKWKPWGRTEIVLTDVTDESNALASVLPYNMIIFRVIPPSPDSSLANYDDYLRVLVSHEYTHIVHMDANRGVWKPFRMIFGKLISPAGLTPLWVREATAVYEETKQTKAGRDRSTYSEMLLRAAILEDNFPTIDRVGVYHWRWPSWEAAYTFGSKFVVYLVQKYGEDKFIEFNRRIQSSPLLTMMNHDARNVYHKTFYELWREWKEYLTEKYKKEEQGLEKEGLTITEPVVKPSWNEQFNNPVISPDAKKLAYSLETPHHSPEIRLKDLETGKDIRIAKQMVSGISWKRDGTKLVYSASGSYKTYSAYYDLWSYDLKTKKKKRLTYGERARYADYSSSGDKIVFVSSNAGTDSLKVFDVETKEFSFISDPLKEPEYVNFADPRYSPDGNFVAVNAWKPDGGWKIYIYSADGKSSRRLTSRSGMETSPWWSEDGKFIYFASDETGITNIYKADVNKGNSERLTNVLIGVFKPTTSDGKKFFVRGYNAEGFYISSFDITRSYGLDDRVVSEITFEAKPTTADVDVKEQEEAAIVGEKIGADINHEDDTEIKLYPTKKYSPFGKSLFLPRFITPYLAYLQDAFFISFLTGASDPLSWHNWIGGLSYRTDAEHFGYFGQYWYNRWKPILGVGINDYAVDFGDLTFTSALGRNTVHYYEQRRNASAHITLPIKRQALSARYFYEDRMPITKLTTPEKNALNLGVFAGFLVGYAYGDAERYLASISKENGRFIKLTGVFTDSIFGGGQKNEQKIFSGDWREYIRIWHHQVLGLRAAGGMTWGDNIVQGTFGLGGDVGEGNLAQGGSYNYFPLRGIPVSALSRTRAMLLSAEYRIPLASPQRGLGTTPIFLNNVYLALFADYGNAWNAHENDNQGFFDEFLLGVGGELRGDFVLGYGLPITGRLGYGIIVVNRDRIEQLKDPLMDHSLKYGMLILQVGTSF